MALYSFTENIEEISIPSIKFAGVRQESNLSPSSHSSPEEDSGIE